MNNIVNSVIFQNVIVLIIVILIIIFFLNFKKNIYAKESWNKLKKTKLAMISFFIILIFITIAILDSVDE